MPTWLISLQLGALFGLYVVEFRTRNRQVAQLALEVLRIAELERDERRHQREAFEHLFSLHERLSVDYTEYRRESEAAIKRLLEELPSIDC